MVSQKLSANQYIIAIFLCGLSYGILLALNAAAGPIGGFVDPLRELPLSWVYAWPFELLIVPYIFGSPMFLAMPFVAFSAMFLAAGWIKENTKTKLSADLVLLLFLLLFAFLAMAAYYLALYWYVANLAALQNIEMSPKLFDFWGKLHSDAFMLFWWGGVFGWLARFAVEKLKL